MPLYKYLLSLLFLVFFFSCQENPSVPTLFEQLTPDQTGIEFVNYLEEKPGNNILESDFFYNGGGVAVGDISGNGLPDIYFTANQGRNALYLNEGDFRFRDITDEARVADPQGWSAGVAMVDINGNGLLDIYVCKSGSLPEDQRRNKLFINNGDLTFTEQANQFGIDDTGYCTQPVFFDFNGNGLLDLFIVNYSTRAFVGFDVTTIRDDHDPFTGDKLYRNNGDGTFTDISRESGILQNPIGFGLSATVSDLNNNGLPDIYVANDFIERDYMYINQGDGTFRDEVLSRTDVISYFSMGSDIADINNNGYPDMLVVDMLPTDYSIQRVFKTPNYNIYDQLIAHDYHRKNMRNMLQLNNGDGTFMEVGQLAGLAKSDWSWSALIADLDNSGMKDIYITNGFPRFYTHLDYLNDILWEKFPNEDLPDDEPELLYELVQEMAEVEMHNFAFRNSGDIDFIETTEEWGLKKYTVSGGAAYVDLNNDGSLDLVVNNLNEPPSLFRNRSRELNSNNFLKVELQGEGYNTLGIGSKVTLTTSDGTVLFQEAYHSRGYQSSIDPVMHFGLGEHETVELNITWPDQSRQVIENVSANQKVTVNQSDATPAGSDEGHNNENPHLLFQLLNQQALGFDFFHESSFFQDRVTSPFMPHTLSNLGPALAIGDVNRDGMPDLFVGGGQGQSAKLYLQQTDGTFNEVDIPDFEEHSEHEDIDALFFDANGNGLLDLYVVSGGNFDPLNGEIYQDRLYFNDGFGNFEYQENALPTMHTSGGKVTALDIDGDGQADLFVGGRVITGQYPSSPRSYLLRNENGVFTDITEELAPDLLNTGMITDAAWADLDDDGNRELILAGEWMPIRIFKQNSNFEYTEITEEAGLAKTSGWWNAIEVIDLNGDGKLDIIAGNRGLNSLFRATPENPAILYNGDFNDNGLLDPLITHVIDGVRYPLPDRDLFLQQLPNFQNQFPTYESYAETTIDDIITEDQKSTIDTYHVHTFASSIFKNQGDGTFVKEPLPRYAQTAPVHDILAADFYDNDLPDILIAGNNYGTRPEMGPMAGQGAILMNNGNFDFDFRSASSSGFYGDGEIRRLEILQSQLGPLILAGRYGDPILVYRYIYEQ